jgi:anti-sigma factor RsiW
MTCRELIEFLDAYVAGDLDDARRRAFDAHLAVCPDCVNYLDSYRRTLRLQKAVLLREEGAPVPASVPAGIMKAIRAARQKP